MATLKINKSAFVRSLPATTSAQDVVKAAAAKGIKLSDKFVHTIRYNAKVAAAKKGGGAPMATSAAAPAKRGPGRPRKLSSATVTASPDAPAKRGPGRPRKLSSATVTASPDAPAKRGPGRPRKLSSAPVTTSPAPAKRGPGRPRKLSSAPVRAAGGNAQSNGLEGEIEHIVEAKVNAILRQRFAGLLSG